MNAVLKTIWSEIDKGQVAVFCGAGVSVPSGIPMVGAYDEKKDRIIQGIITQILLLTGHNDNDIKAYFKVKIPFEAFIEFLVQNGLDLAELEPLFHGEPCIYHRAIARLMKQGKISQVCTANFDRCFEIAIQNETIKDLIVAYEVQKFPLVIKSAPNRLLVKIHGSVDDMQSIAITIREITKKVNRERDEMVNHFFLRGTTHKTLLVIGYSCSDYFDIVPQVKLLIRDKPSELCRLIFWEFEYGASPREVKLDELSNNAKVMLNGHPNLLLVKGDLAAMFTRRPILKVLPPAPAIPWEIILQNIYSKLTSIQQELLKARLFYRINNHADAYNIFKQIIDNKLSSQKELAIALSNQALILKHWGRLDDALLLHDREEAIYTTLNDRKGLIISFGNQALVMRRLGRIDEALVLHKKEEEICRDLNDEGGIGRSYGNQALALKYQNKYDDALELHRKELDIFVTVGDKSGEARSYGNKALILRRQGKAVEAMDLVRKEEDIYVELGIKNLLAHNYESQALILRDLGDYNQAVVFHQKAEALYFSSDDQWGLATTFANQAELQAEFLHHKTEGLSLIAKAIAIANFHQDGRLKDFLDIEQRIINL